VLDSPIRVLVHTSQEYVFHKTLFCEPLPSPKTLLLWIRSAWAKASRDIEQQASLEVSCTRQVSISHPEKSIYHFATLVALESLELTNENQIQVIIPFSEGYDISSRYCISLHKL